MDVDAQVRASETGQGTVRRHQSELLGFDIRTLSLFLTVLVWSDLSNSGLLEAWNVPLKGMALYNLTAN